MGRKKQNENKRKNGHVILNNNNSNSRCNNVVVALVVCSTVVLSRSLPSPRDGVAVRDGLGGAGEMRRVPRPPPFNTFCHELSPPRQLQSTPSSIGQPPPRAFHHGR